MAGTLFVVATPIGNLEDISARALRVLREVTVVAAEDTRHTGHLLQRFGIATRTISYHEHSERGKAEGILDRLRAGESVALVSDAGTPTLSDPGAYLVRIAHAAGIRVEPVPGPSAVVAALSASGFSGDSFIFLGFPPKSGTARSAWFDRLRRAADVSQVAVFFEAPHRIGRTTEDLVGRFGDVEVCVARELTKAHEEVRVAKLSAVTDQPGRGEFTVVLDLSRLTKTSTASVPDTQRLVDEFGHLTSIDGLTRRQAISEISRKYQVSAKHIYAELEAAKRAGV